MDGWLKGLIAAACVVVIAGGGYAAYTAYAAHSFEAKCGDFLALNRDVIATRGENESLKKAAMEAMRKVPSVCLDMAQKELRQAF